MKLHQHPKVRGLGDVIDFKVNRGEINQTIYRRYIVDDSSKARLLKGVEVARYGINEELSQGEREWFDEARFLAEHRSRPLASVRRIATQRVTGVDERWRIVGTIVEPPTYFADSTNSIAIAEESEYRLEYLLGLLNSRLWQFRFNTTSTNNNVGTNELDSMPFRTVAFDDPADVQRHDQLGTLVNDITSLVSRLAAARVDHERRAYERRIEAIDRRIENLVAELYGLTDSEQSLVAEQPVTFAGAAS